MIIHDLIQMKMSINTFGNYENSTILKLEQ